MMLSSGEWRFDPFRLSLWGRVRARMAWLRGPAFLPRWVVGCAVTLLASTFAGVSVLLVMHAASPPLTIRSWPGGTAATWPVQDARSAPLVPKHPTLERRDPERMGPVSASIVDMPGFPCAPSDVAFPPRWSAVDGPLIVVVGPDHDGSPVLWGPSCVVSGGRAAS